jgi:segregation and condensation protein A
MNLQVAEHQTEGYRINTTVYEGPLDLLLDLIEHAELDITRLALAQVTDQYLAYLHDLEDRNPAEVSAFLVIAARLVQIKSSALLPRPSHIEHSEEDVDDGEALAQQLIQYRRFKQLAAWLSEQEAANRRTYLRLNIPIPRIDARLDMSEITLEDLTLLAFQVFIGKADLPALSRVVSMPRVTIREKIHIILNILRRSGRASFKNLAVNQNRLEIVITFLAMLELIKRSVIDAEQPDLFGDISLLAIGDLGEDQEDQVEIEFEE